VHAEADHRRGRRFRRGVRIAAITVAPAIK